MSIKSLVALFLGVAALLSLPQDEWASADTATLRLPPTAFSRLPRNVVQYLQRHGCTIPQTYLSREPHNVISGEFARRGQSDWAVLCSRNGESSIMVFWRGFTRSVSVVAKAPDRNFLQTITKGGKFGFSRMIEAVDREYILKHSEAYGGSKPPIIRHQGIDDAFVEKASVVRYFYRRKWLELQGAD